MVAASLVIRRPEACRRDVFVLGAGRERIDRVRRDLCMSGSDGQGDRMAEDVNAAARVDARAGFEVGLDVGPCRDDARFLRREGVLVGGHVNEPQLFERDGSLRTLAITQEVRDGDGGEQGDDRDDDHDFDEREARTFGFQFADHGCFFSVLVVGFLCRNAANAVRRWLRNKDNIKIQALFRNHSRMCPSMCKERFIKIYHTCE